MIFSITSNKVWRVSLLMTHPLVVVWRRNPSAKQHKIVNIHTLPPKLSLGSQDLAFISTLADPSRCWDDGSHMSGPHASTDLFNPFYYPCTHVPPKHGALPLRKTGNGAWQRGSCRKKLLCELSILRPELYHQVLRVLLFVLHIDIAGSICWLSTRDRTGIQAPQP